MNYKNVLCGLVIMSSMTHIKAKNDNLILLGLASGVAGGAIVCHEINKRGLGLVGDTAKAAILMGLVALWDTYQGKSKEIKNDIVHLSLLFGSYAMFNNDFVGHIIKKIPFLNGLCTDHSIAQEQESSSGIGRLMRWLIPYVVIKELAQDRGLLSNKSKWFIHRRWLK